jgi:hypothetical protein
MIAYVKWQQVSRKILINKGYHWYASFFCSVYNMIEEVAEITL